MLRLRKVNDCYVRNYHDTDLVFYDKDFNMVRVLEDNLAGSDKIVIATTKGKGIASREDAEIINKGSRPFFINTGGTFPMGGIVVFKDERDERVGIVKKDHGESIDMLVMAPRYNMAEDVIEDSSVTSALYMREEMEEDLEALRTALNIKGGEELVNKYFKPKHEFKPFDKVLMRHKEVMPFRWFPTFFACEEGGKFYDTSGISFDECIPYEGNEELTMTDREP